MNGSLYIILIILLSILLVGTFSVLIHQQKSILHLKKSADDTERSKQQIIVEQNRNQQIKQELTSNISHELKTPISSIRGYLEILLGDKPVDDEKRRFFIERCYAQTMRLSDLVNDVSLINKLEESSDLFPKENVSVSELLIEAMFELEDRCAAHNIKVYNHLDDRIVVNGNRSLIYGIFRNLLENTVAYAGENIEVVAECYKETADMFYLHFYDTGVGADNQYIPKIFDRFVRGDEGRSRKNGGTGLGLSIVKHAVQFHGGEIYAKNREAGGLEFFFSLKK